MLFRTLRTAKLTLTRVFMTDEQPVGATGTVTVTVRRLDGLPATPSTAAVPATVVDTQAASGPDANQVYTYVFPGLDTLDRLQVSWSATVNGDAIVIDSDFIEVCGGFLFSLTEGRAVDSALSSTSKYPTSLLTQKRIETEDECERICGQAFVPRFAREVLDGRDRPWLRLRWPWIRTVRNMWVRTTPSSSYIQLTSTQLANVVGGDDGVIRADQGVSWMTVGYWWGTTFPAGRSNIIVEYEHGLDAPQPDLVRGAKFRFKSLVLQPSAALSDRSERIGAVVAGSYTGAVAMANPGEDQTGIAEVDGAYKRHSRPVPSFG